MSSEIRHGPDLEKHWQDVLCSQVESPESTVANNVRKGWHGMARPYSLKSRDCAAAATAAGVLRRAMPTTPSTVTSESAARGTKIRSVEEFKSGGVICKPFS